MGIIQTSFSPVTQKFKKSTRRELNTVKYSTLETATPVPSRLISCSVLLQTSGFWGLLLRNIRRLYILNDLVNKPYSRFKVQFQDDNYIWATVTGGKPETHKALPQHRQSPGWRCTELLQGNIPTPSIQGEERQGDGRPSAPGGRRPRQPPCPAR